MPSLPHDQATLDEVLEVRGEPLQEQELWALLLESGNALKSILLKGERDDRLQHLALNLRPDTLLLCLNGRIKFAITKYAKADTRFIPPESYSKKERSKSKFEMMLVYSLGMTMLTAAENGDDVKYSISRDLESVLCNMVEDSCHMRISVAEIIQVSLGHVDSMCCYMKIKNMATEIVGPYGLEPLSATTQLILPTPVKSLTNGHHQENYPFDPGPTAHIEPIEMLTPVIKSQGKGITIDLTDYNRPSKESFARNSWDIDNRQIKSPHVKYPLSPRSLNMDNGKASSTTTRTPPEAKAWSPTYSSPDFKILMDMEEKKLDVDGYGRDVPRMISPNKNYRSMPALNDLSMHQHSPPMSGIQHKHKTRDTTFGLSRHRSASFLADGTSIVTPTSQYSSQVSLTQGAYVLDADYSHWGKEYSMRRFGSGSTISQYSDDGSKYFTTVQPHQYRPIDLPHLGPEFVRVSSDPDTAFVDITPPRLGPLPKGTRQISVFLPNTQKLQTNVQVSSKGKELFDQIVVYLSLKETVYFGLTQIRDEEHHFLDLDSKLTKFAPTGWKEENPKKRKNEFVLHFKVKFFVDNPSSLKHKLTTHLYYIQLRQDLLSGYTHCPDETLLTLTSYALQAEYGPFEPEYHGTEYFRIENYLPGRVLSRMSRLELLRKLPLRHQVHNALEVHEAESGFLEEAKKLPEYGVIFHKVSRSKNIETDIVWLGICIKGIIILEPKGKQRAAVHKQEWNLIKEFNFEKKKFLIKPKNPEEHPKMIFYTNHYRRSKYLFKMCQSFHRFQVFNESRTSNSMKGSMMKREVKMNTTPFLRDDKKADINQQIDKDKKIVLVKLKKALNDGLGITIVGGEDSNRISPGIFIKKIKPGSLCAIDGRLAEGDKILSVNGQSLETASHEEAVDVLRNAGNEIELIVSKVVGNASILDLTGLSPNINHSHLIRDDHNKWQNNTEQYEDLKEKLFGIDFIDDESEDQFSERPIDVPSKSPASKVAEEKRLLSAKAIPDKTYEIQVESPRGIFLVNDVEINHKGESPPNSETEDSITEQNTTGTLKRFNVFEELHKIDSLDHPDSSHLETSHLSPNEEKNVVKCTTQQADQQIMNETIEEIDFEIERVGGSYGFSIMGGIESSLPLGGIYIRSLQENRMLKGVNNIRVGDRVLSINGTSLEHVSHKEAVKIIKNSPHYTSITIDRGIEISSEYLTTVSPVDKIRSLREENPKQHVFEIDVQKGNDGLGLSLIGGRESDIVYQEQLMIKKLFPGQPMAKTGKFQLGDIILAINDQIIEGMTLQQALSVIRNSSKKLKIIAKRPNKEDIPAELFINSRPVSPEKIIHDFQKKDMPLEGRHSREGNRIAKELLRSMTYNDTDDSANDFSFSQDSSSDENNDEEDGINESYHNETLVLPPPPPPSQPKERKTPSPVDLHVKTLPKLKTFTHVAENLPLATSTPSPRAILEELADIPRVEHVSGPTSDDKKEIRSKFADEETQSKTDSDSPIGYRRHRPSKQKPKDSIELDVLKKTDEPDVLYLVKDEQRRHGLLFENLNNQLVVKEVIKEQPADLQQAFQKGLVIVSINGHSTKSFTPQMAYTLISSSGARIKFGVKGPVRQETGSSPFNAEPKHVDVQSTTSPVQSNLCSPLRVMSPPTAFRFVPGSPVLKRLDFHSRSPSHGSESRRVSSSSMASTTGEVILVQLEKGSKGLGITLGTENDKGGSFVFIKKIVAGSVADDNGQLHAKDRLISVNGENVEDLSQKEIVARFRKLSGTVALECFRPPDNHSPTHKSNPSASINPLTLPKLPQTVGAPSVDNLVMNTVNNDVMSTNHEKHSVVETAFTSDKVTFDSSAAMSFANSYSIVNSDDNDTDVDIDFDTTPLYHPQRQQIRGIKRVLSPIESASATLEHNDVEEDDMKIVGEVGQSGQDSGINIADLALPPPPEIPDEVGWSSDDALNSQSLDISIPGMDVNGVIQASNSSQDNSIEIDTKINTVARTNEPRSEDCTSENEHKSKSSPTSKVKTDSPVKVTSRPPSGTSSSHSMRSGIPRLIRSRSNSLTSESSRSSSRKQTDSQDVISVDIISKDDAALQERFIERRNFVFYTKDRVNKLIKSIESKMESVQINAEFMILRQVKITSTCDVGNRACNRSKNRNKSIIPYDANRVTLTGGEETDYINASHVKIPLDRKTLNYIVTQAPLESTVSDFWRCIWEQKVEVIVMLTKLYEGRKEKCFQYWPNAKDSPMKILDKFEIELLYEEDNGAFIYRQIQLRNFKLDKSLFITQAAFTEWPDSGVPKDVIEFLGFMKFVQSFQNSSPTLVHCSCGVGRSGTYIVIDSAWSAIELDIMFEVGKITRTGKEQRQLLIQTKEQYQFCYRSIRELLEDIPW